MKVKEKGLDASSIQRGAKPDGSARPSGDKHDTRPKKFNAFKEVERIKASGGQVPDFIDAPGGAKRKRGADEESGEAKKVKQVRGRWYAGEGHGYANTSCFSQETGPLTISYNDKPIQVDRKTGAVIDKSELAFPENAVLKFSNCGSEGDWKKLKVRFGICTVCEIAPC